jgi:outer membrane protein, heavy metal efflux system
MKRVLLIIGLLTLLSPYVFAAGTVSERNQQIKNQEKIIKNNAKSEIAKIGADAKLDDYIKAGLKDNPGLKAAFYEWKSSFAKISRDFSLPDPQFTYTDYIESVETRVGPQNKSYSINQKFPFPDKLWIRKNKAFKASEEAFYDFNKRRLDLINRIIDAYYEYAYLSKAVLLMKENIKLLKNFESVAQAKYKSGLVQNQDLLKVQVELGKLENELLSLEDLRLPLIARLNALLYLPKDNILPWPDETLEDVVMEHKYEEINGLYDELTKNNPELLSLTENIEKNKDTLKLAKRDYFPDFTVGVTTIDTGDALSPNTVDSGKDPLMVMFSVNVPIWFNRLNAGVREAKASLKASESLLENKQNELLSRLALVHYKLRDALRQSYLYKDALLPKAAQTLNATQSGYEGGKVDFLSLIDAQRVLLDFQLAYYRQNTGFYQRLAELKSLLGELQTDEEWEGLVNP